MTRPDHGQAPGGATEPAAAAPGVGREVEDQARRHRQEGPGAAAGRRVPGDRPGQGGGRQEHEARDRTLRGDSEEARRHLDRAASLGGGLEREREPGVDALQAFARLQFAQMAGDFDGLLQAIPTLPASTRGHEVRATKRAHLASVFVARGDLHAAQDRFEEALDLGLECSAGEVVVSALAGLALVAASRGWLRRAGALATEALARGEALGMTDALETLGAQVSLGWVHLHRDELDLAAARADRAGDLVRRHGYLPGRVLWGILATMVLGARGPGGAADGLRRLRAVRDDLGGLRGAPFYRLSVLGLEARLLIARGDSLDQAFAALDREQAADEPQVAMVAARLLLLAGRPEEALARLGSAAAGPPVWHPALAIESLTLQSLALSATDQAGRARAVLQQALEQAAPDSYRRVFVEGGPMLAALLREHLRSGVGQRPFTAEVLAAFERRAPAVELTTPELVEPLSAREQAVLRYLPTLMSNDEIARALSVSVNTVKTHLRHLYGKLGATGRRDAIERGRRLNLL